MRQFKQPPPREGMLWCNTSLEVQINLSCNWHCAPCDAFSNYSGIHWIKTGTMTVGQIEYFAKEMREKNAYFGRVRVLGGEPTLNPKLEEISACLSELVKEGHLGTLEMVTNASHMEKVAEVRHYYNKVRRSDAADKSVKMTANLLNTPNTLGVPAIRCNSPEHCGWSLTRWGFFGCSAGAGLARLMNDIPRWQRLELPHGKTEDVWPDLITLCGACYHGLPQEFKIKCPPDDYKTNTPHPVMWEHLAPWLNGQSTPKAWGVYGMEKQNA